jgi:hypothetical protein
MYISRIIDDMRNVTVRKVTEFSRERESTGEFGQPHRPRIRLSHSFGIVQFLDSFPSPPSTIPPYFACRVPRIIDALQRQPSGCYYRLDALTRFRGSYRPQVRELDRRPLQTSRPGGIPDTWSPANPGALLDSVGSVSWMAPGTAMSCLSGETGRLTWVLYRAPGS